MSEKDPKKPGTKKPTLPPGMGKKPTLPPGAAKKPTLPPGMGKKPTLPPGAGKRPTMPPGPGKMPPGAPAGPPGGDGASVPTRADFSSDQDVRWCPGCGDMPFWLLSSG